MPSTVPSLPKWKCHKIVEADKIVAITYDEHGLHWHLECGRIVNISPFVIGRGQPKTGDYYVVYSDNYVSWSPQRAFEEGYERYDLIEETVNG